MKTFEYLKAKAKSLKKEITAIYYAYQNPNLSLLAKISIFVTIGYALSPIDLIPDFIPVIGYLDDIIILPILITLSLKLIPKEIMEESRKKAQETPLRLKDNWVFAAIFIIIWIILLAIILNGFLK